MKLLREVKCLKRGTCLFPWVGKKDKTDHDWFNFQTATFFKT